MPLALRRLYLLRARSRSESSQRSDYAPALCILGLIDAGLGRKQDAISEGLRAVELLPVTRDPINGAHMIEFRSHLRLTGERDLACDQLEIAIKIPGT